MPESPRFSPAALEEVKRLVARYPEGRAKSALIPVLHRAQRELGGWLSVPVMDYVASLLDLKPIEVYEVASFYTLFDTKPVGRYKLEPCRTGPCALNGAEDLIAYLERTLSIRDGETTPDGLFTLRSTECLGACDQAPLMQVGDTLHTRLTNEAVDALLDGLRKQAAAAGSGHG